MKPTKPGIYFARAQQQPWFSTFTVADVGGVLVTKSNGEVIPLSELDWEWSEGYKGPGIFAHDGYIIISTHPTDEDLKVDKIADKNDPSTPSHQLTIPANRLRIQPEALEILKSTPRNNTVDALGIAVFKENGEVFVRWDGSYLTGFSPEAIATKENFFPELLKADPSVKMPAPLLKTVEARQEKEKQFKQLEELFVSLGAGVTIIDGGV
jgi:hypothetical protein